jgi:hypothetical protein
VVWLSTANIITERSHQGKSSRLLFPPAPQTCPATTSSVVSGSAAYSSTTSAPHEYFCRTGSGSEFQPQAHLDGARGAVLGRQYAEASRGLQRERRIHELDPIQDVDEVRRQDRRQPFIDFRLFSQRCVYVPVI